MTLSPAQSLILIVDPYSTGCMVAQEISKRGYPIMAVWVRVRWHRNWAGYAVINLVHLLHLRC